MDPIADMLIRIKNAQMARAERVLIPSSKMKAQIAVILKEAGYVADVDKRKRKAKKVEHEWLDIGLRYENNLGAISGVKLISKPSRHMYAGAKEIKPVQSGYGIAVLSTPNGILSSKEARKQNVGGEILFEIW